MPFIFSEPPITTGTAHLLTTLFVFCYVGSLYLSKNARLSFSSDAPRSQDGTAREKQQNERWRDDPDVIRARLLAVGIATLVCCAVVFVVLWQLSGDVDRDEVCKFLVLFHNFKTLSSYHALLDIYNHARIYDPSSRPLFNIPVNQTIPRNTIAIPWPVIRPLPIPNPTIPETMEPRRGSYTHLCLMARCSELYHCAFNFYSLILIAVTEGRAGTFN